MRAPPHGLSQLATSFFACPRLGIPRAPLLRLARSKSLRTILQWLACSFRPSTANPPNALTSTLTPALSISVAHHPEGQCAQLKKPGSGDSVGRQSRRFQPKPTRCLQKGGDPAAGSPTATLLRLRPSYRACLRPLPPCGWDTDFGHSRLPWRDGRCVQGPGTYSPRRG